MIGHGSVIGRGWPLERDRRWLDTTHRARTPDAHPHEQHFFSITNSLSTPKRGVEFINGESAGECIFQVYYL